MPITGRMDDEGYERGPEQATDCAVAAMATAMVSILAVKARGQETELQEDRSSQVWVKTLEGGTAAVRIKEGDTTENLRQVVARKLNVPPKLPRLMYGGRQLREHEPLHQQGVCHGATVHVVFRLRGGSGVEGDINMDPTAHHGEPSAEGLEAAAGYIGEVHSDFWGSLQSTTKAEVVANFTTRAKNAGKTQDTLWNLAVEAGAPAATEYAVAMRMS
uniref:Ubiquitin-like domain-containing protein n=1 Tax=Eutreptiella gymnastica TaxID=73025 RepID=A0A7S1JEW6_9EUGL|mmetsp:Transcript_89702/g.155305  ORF Transcript_89702/g.155305 Transcript_89702/m.155305 type:complete len:217 (+) Transcript_89702:88-738(+)